MQQALETAFAELIFGPPIDPNDAAAVNAWLDRSGLSEADAAAIRAGGVARLFVYRDLVRSTLRDVLATMLPRTRARLGESAFATFFDRFLAGRGPRTHYLRDVSAEFVEFCVPVWRGNPDVPAYLGDLARYEVLEFDVAARGDEADISSDALALDRPVRFIRACAIVRFDHAVHELVDDPSDTTVPTRRPTALFVYRDRAHEVRFLALSPLAAAILTELIAGRSLGDATAAGCDVLGAAMNQEALDALSRVLADLADRGALLGSG